MSGARIRRYLTAGVLAISVLGLASPASAGPADQLESTQSRWVPAPGRQPVGDPDQSAGHVVGTLRIPAIGVDETVRAGIDLAVINRGPAHWVGTSRPGESGNVVLAGHRTTYGGPFHDLHRLAPGDLVYVTDPLGFEMMYRVSETFVVSPDAVWITYDNGEPMLTMFACHPLGSAAQRIVVRADLVAGRPIA